MKYGKFLLSVLFLFMTLPSFAQTSADIERILDQKEISCEQAAWFTLAAALEEPIEGSQAAFNLAVEKGWLPQDAQGSDPITCGGFSYLAMQAFGMKCGMMYRIFENKRYAYREMKYRGYIAGRAWSNSAVSGEQFLQILGNVMADLGGEW